MFKVPKKTTVWKTDPSSAEKYVLQFAPELINFIRQKKKYRTYRFGLEKDYLQVGDIIIIIKENFKVHPSWKAKITEKTKTIFKDLPLNANGHEVAKNKEHQREVLSGYYAFLGRPIRDDDEFLIFDFELLQ